jgi:hypothetical protein
MGSIKTPDERLAQWERRYDPARICELMTAEKPVMSARAREAFQKQYEMEVSVKQVLGAVGVSVSDVANYLCFGRQVSKADRRHNGGVTDIEAQVLLSKWSSRGLDPAVLRRILVETFHIEL